MKQITKPITLFLLLAVTSLQNIHAQVVSTFADGRKASFNSPCGIALDAFGNKYVTDEYNHKIRKINPDGIVSTFAGSGVAGSTDGVGKIASFITPRGLAVDVSGNVYVADMGNNKIRKISPSGVVSTLAGGGLQGSTDGLGTVASFYNPAGIAVDASGNVYVADTYNHKIRKISPSGEVSTLAGSGIAGSKDSVSTEASFDSPTGVAVDPYGAVYVVDNANFKIRKISPQGEVTTFAGSGIADSTDGVGTEASFNYPYGITLDRYANIYVADARNNKIRKISSWGLVTTIAGSAEGSADGTMARFYSPSGIAVDASGVIYVADYNNQKIRKIHTDGVVSTFAGTGVRGDADGAGTEASFIPHDVTLDGFGNVYIPNHHDNKIQKISTSGKVSTLAGNDSIGSADGLGAAASFYEPSGTAIDASGNVYVADVGNNKIRKISPSGMVSTLAGSGERGSVDGQGTEASFSTPQDVAVDVSGNVYVADQSNNKIRKISPSGEVSTFAGSGVQGSDDGLKITASFNNPPGVAVDASGNVYVADMNNNKIRKISPNGVVSTLAGNGTQGSVDGPGNVASFNNPARIALDASGNVYVADMINHKIRKISASGVVSTLAGSGTQGSIDDVGTAASFNYPLGLAFDASGNLYVADMNNSKIRKITMTSASNTFASACSSYTWNGTIYTSSGIKTFVTKNALGSDSTATLNLTIKQPSTFTKTHIACSSYTWNGTTYTTSGTKTFSTTNAKGCDSIATLNLTIKQPSTSTKTHTACSSYTWNGTIYTTSGTKTYRTTNTKGCDSTATLNLTINKPSTSIKIHTACSSYTWNGTTYTTSGTKTFRTTNIKGCDSTATLNLTINPSTSTITHTACISYTWNSRTYTTSGTKTFRTTNAKGCDSIATLNLTINQRSSSTNSATACISYTWNGTIYTTSGAKTFSTTNAKGCDSTATLNLTIKQPSTSIKTHTACSSYTWNGTIYTTSGTKTFSTTNAKGCDSTATLNLTINQPSTSTNSATACGSYTWNGTTYTTSGAKTFSTTNAKRCDSTATLNLTITSCTPTTCAWNGTAWSNGTPTAITDITIDGVYNAAIHGSLTVRDITIHANGHMNISTGSVSARNITIKNNGSLNHTASNLTLSGSATVERTGKSGDSSYNYWSSPIANGALPGTKKYAYVETTRTTSDYQSGWASWGTAMTVGKGYAATGGGTNNFVGNLNSGNIAVQMTHSNIGTVVDNGWNLLGNPYPSEINLASFFAANSVTGNAAYLWNGANYVTLNSGSIPSCQGFFVQSTSTKSANFTDAMRQNGSQSLFRTEAESAKVLLKMEGAGHTDQTQIELRTEATDGYDQAFDAFKLKGNADLQLYSKISGSPYNYAINILGEGSKTIPLMYDAKVAGAYTISAAELTGLPLDATVVLSDMLTGAKQNLANGAYTFQSGTTSEAQRFNLLIGKAIVTSMDETTNDESATIFAYSNTVYAAKAGAFELSIYNINGVLVSKMSAKDKLSIPMAQSGLYVVKLTSENITSTHKVIIVE